jgi:hypothetical protein
MTLMVNNLNYITFNFYPCGINTRKKLKLHRPTAKLHHLKNAVAHPRILFVGGSIN